jgi:TusA-related sulfurtransferase
MHNGPAMTVDDSELDLRGVRCPLNWAHAKVRLEGLPRGARLTLVLDDLQALRDIPRAAEAEGYAVDPPVERGSLWRLRIHV